MATNQKNYDFILSKIQDFKTIYPGLRNMKDDYVFSALAIKSNLYKNPALKLSEENLVEMIVDGPKDGGVDALLIDPNSDANDLVLVQSKLYQSISYEEIINAIDKLIEFYKGMKEGHYEEAQNKVSKRFSMLDSEGSEESKTVFTIYTSAPKGNARIEKIQKYFYDHLNNDQDKFEIRLYYSDELCSEIREAESLRADVEAGTIIFDKPHNHLFYDDENAVIVNASAFCIKELYNKEQLNLLSRNLRYHIKGGKIDSAIKASIAKDPEDFWYKNNGLTIICDDFRVDGREVKLKNFSIVNGGQTTYNLYTSKDLSKSNDFYIPCKIIKSKGITKEERDRFSLEIAKATNSQKAIKPIDLKANSPEQVSFSKEMRLLGIFYQTKRGEEVPERFEEDYLNTDLADTGKLCLAGIFQMPATSRNKPSMLYNDKYYGPIFNDNQKKIANLAKELLYFDYYFKKHFSKRIEARYKDNDNSADLIPFANVSRTICIAFTAFASRYYQKNISSDDMRVFFANIGEGSAYDTHLYPIFKNLDGFDHFFPGYIFENKTKLDEILDKLFDAVILAGSSSYVQAKIYNTTLDASNYLKKDINYYNFLKVEWSRPNGLSTIVNDIFRELDF